MTAQGHLRPIDLPPEFAACPLHPESGQTGRHLAKSALCQSRLNALQQKAPLLYQSDVDQLHQTELKPLEEDHALALGRLETALCQRVKLESSESDFYVCQTTADVDCDQRGDVGDRETVASDKLVTT